MADDYDISEEKPRRAAQPTVRAPGAPLVYQKRKADDGFEEQVRDLHVPVILLAGGVAVECIAAWARSSGGAGTAIRVIGIWVVLWTGLLIASGFVAARLRQIDLGSFHTAALKFGAIAVGPSAIFTLVMLWLHLIPFGTLIGLAIVFVLYFALIGFFFDLDQGETWYLVMVFFLLRLALIRVAIWLL